MCHPPLPRMLFELPLTAHCITSASKNNFETAFHTPLSHVNSATFLKLPFTPHCACKNENWLRSAYMSSLSPIKSPLSSSTRFSTCGWVRCKKNVQDKDSAVVSRPAIKKLRTKFCKNWSSYGFPVLACSFMNSLTKLSPAALSIFCFKPCIFSKLYCLRSLK